MNQLPPQIAMFPQYVGQIPPNQQYQQLPIYPQQYQLQVGFIGQPLYQDQLQMPFFQPEQYKKPLPKQQKVNSSLPDPANFDPKTYKFITDFDRLNDYTNLQAIREKFSTLKNVNKDQVSLDNEKNPSFFIIKSTSFDNLHKAMKYGKWTTTPKNLQKLSKAYHQSDKSVILFFTVVNSDSFYGVAKMSSDQNLKEHFRFWEDNNKWFASFNVEWIFVKSLDVKLFKNVLEQDDLTKQGYNKNIGVHEVVDSTQIPKKGGLAMFKIYKESNEKASLFDDFAKFDFREDHMRSERLKDPQNDQIYEELSKQFEEDPQKFQNQRKMKPMKQFNYPDPYMAQPILLPQPFPINKITEDLQQFHIQEEVQEGVQEDPTLKNVPLEERFNILKKEQKEGTRKRKKLRRKVDDYTQEGADDQNGNEDGE